MTEKMIRDACGRIRIIDQTIPDDVLDFMKNASIEKLKQVNNNIVLADVSNAKRTFCNNCKSGLIDYPEINRRTCRCGALGYNVTEKF